MWSEVHIRADMGFINFKYLYIYLSVVIGGGGGRGGNNAIFLISYSLLCNGICSIKILRNASKQVRPCTGSGAPFNDKQNEVRRKELFCLGNNEPRNNQDV